MKKPAQLLLLAMACLALPVNRTLAKSATEYWQDTKDYVTAPMRWEPDDLGHRQRRRPGNRGVPIQLTDPCAIGLAPVVR